MIKVKRKLITIFVVLVVLIGCVSFIFLRTGKGYNMAVKRREPPRIITFEKTYGSQYADEGKYVLQTNDGGYILVGYTGGLFMESGADVYLVKTDSEGNEIWEKTYGGEKSDWGNYVAQTNDGGFIIVGTTTSFGAGLEDVYLIKTDSEGNEIWEKTYGGRWNDEGNCVAQTSDGGYIIVGETGSFGQHGDIFLIKTDSEGNEIWEKTLGGGNIDKGNSIIPTSDGGYVIVGTTVSFGAGWEDVYLIKIDSEGNKIWEKTYGGSHEDYGYSVAQTSDGGYIIGGTTFSFPAGRAEAYFGVHSAQFYLIKTDSEGNEIWEKTFGAEGGDEWGMSVSPTSDGGYIIVGKTWSYGAGLADVYLIKTDSEGNELWEKTFGGGNVDTGYCVAPANDGGYIIVGSTGSFGMGSSDVYLIKTDSEGNVYEGEITKNETKSGHSYERDKWEEFEPGPGRD
jgi:hypothetical protein